jgi:hypothetical protein
MHIEQVQGRLPVSGGALRRLGELAAAAPERKRPAGVGVRGPERTHEASTLPALGHLRKTP